MLVAGAAALSFASAQIAQADDFPSRPVHIVIAFPPGGPTDFVGRVVAEKMRDTLGQPVIIDNKPGANGTLGGEFVAKSDPDGYTLFLTTAGAVTVSPHIMADLHYDPLRDFAPVALVTTVTEVLAVTPKSGIKTAKELVALAKEKPGAIAFASTGIGSPPHLAQELLDASAGVQFLHVPYRGAAPALTDLLGGQVEVLAADIAGADRADPGRQSGADRRGGGQARRHSAGRADARRAGLSQHRRVELVRRCSRRPRRRAAVIAKINQAVNAALTDPPTRDKLVQAGATPVGDTPESFGTFMKAEYDKWGRVVKERNIKGRRSSN